MNEEYREGVMSKITDLWNNNLFSIFWDASIKKPLASQTLDFALCRKW
jgi:hypothetical protein